MECDLCHKPGNTFTLDVPGDEPEDPHTEKHVCSSCWDIVVLMSRAALKQKVDEIEAWQKKQESLLCEILLGFRQGFGDLGFGLTEEPLKTIQEMIQKLNYDPQHHYDATS
jgi:hypothetical protein